MICDVFPTPIVPTPESNGLMLIDEFGYHNILIITIMRKMIVIMNLVMMMMMMMMTKWW